MSFAAPVRSEDGAPGGQAGATGVVGVRAKPALTPEDQLAQADAIQKRGQALALRLSKMLDEARREKDIMRANCINRKLTEVNANVGNVNGRAKALNDAVKGGDDGRRSHEFTVLSVMSQKFDQAEQEASQCLGQAIYQSGASQVVTTIPADDPSDVNPTAIGAPPPAPPAVTVPPAKLSGTD